MASFSRRQVIAIAVGLSASPPAFAKQCDLDLQIVFVNAAQAIKEDPLVQGLDLVTSGLASVIFGAFGDSVVYEEAAADVEQGMGAYGLTGYAKKIGASLSGRASGWQYWDPSTQAKPAKTVWSSESMGDYWMLAIHVDDPKLAARTIGKVSGAGLFFGGLFGVDIRAKVYWALFQKMVPSLQTRSLRVLVNTGEHVRCADVNQRYTADYTPY